MLSIGAGAALEQVVVLSDNRVATKVFAGKPVQRRDILSLSDWLMLTEGQNITASSMTPQLPPSPLAGPVPEPVAPPPEPEPVYSVGTMLRWKKDDSNKRIALVMKDGVLQVKEVLNGEIVRAPDDTWRIKRTFYKDVAEWKASLAQGGTVTAEENVASSTSSLEDKAKKPITSTTDVGYIAELKKRYSVHSRLDNKLPTAERIEVTRKTLKESLDALNASFSKGDRGLLNVSYHARIVKDWAQSLNSSIEDIRGKTQEELNRVTYRFENAYKQKIFAFKCGMKYEISCTDTVIGLSPATEGVRARWYEDALTGKTFADLGIEMKSDGKPRLEVSYRRRRIEL